MLEITFFHEILGSFQSLVYQQKGDQIINQIKGFNSPIEPKNKRKA
jgi:hypothetical protein